MMLVKVKCRKCYGFGIISVPKCMGGVTEKCPQCDHRGYEYAEAVEKVLVSKDIDSLVHKWQWKATPDSTQCMNDLLALVQEPKE